MKTRGFTAVECAIVISISAILVPLGYLLLREVTATSEDAFFRLDVANAVRALGDQLEADAARTECEAHWRLEPDGALVRSARESCGGEQVVTRGVSRLERVADGVELTFEKALRPDRTVTVDVFLAEVMP